MKHGRGEQEGKGKEGIAGEMGRRTIRSILDQDVIYYDKCIHSSFSKIYLKGDASLQECGIKRLSDRLPGTPRTPRPSPVRELSCSSKQVVTFGFSSLCPWPTERINLDDKMTVYGRMQ